MSQDGTPPPSVDAPPFRGPTRRRVSRRALLRAAGLATLSLPALLAACERLPPTELTKLTDWDEWWAGRERTGTLDFANWPYYIDRGDGGRPSLELFIEETGIQVDYDRPINGNEPFFERIRPGLAAGEPIGWDIIVLTNGPILTRMIEEDWLTPLDHSLLPNFALHASELVRDPAWDPGNRYTIAWQSGMTGIAYRPEAAEALGREPRRILDLWDPALKGRVGMMSDTLDLGSAGLLAIGVDPQSSSPSDWPAAEEALTEQRASGVVRGYYDQSYLRAIRDGRTWASQAWSGDIYQLNRLGHGELHFVVPEEGAMFWTDNMMIPRGAAHPLDAITYMNYVYAPRIAALITHGVRYISPVPEAARPLAGRLESPELARSPLVFPRGEELRERVNYYYVFEDPQEADAWQDMFERIILDGVAAGLETD